MAVIEKNTLRNVTDRDMDEIVPWLLASLKPQWPRLQEDNLRHWLHAATNDRTAKLCRTDRVVGLFFMQRDVMEPNGIVREKFVRHKNAPLEEQRAFYGEVAEWARTIKARSLVVCEDTNCDALQDKFFGASQPGAAVVRKKISYVMSFAEAK